VESKYFQKGFQLKSVVSPVLEANYHSGVVERLKEFGYAAQAGDLKLRLAREFGFCYGVDRAVEYAYQTRERFPDRRLFLAGEIIHNPEVNRRIAGLGIRILPDDRDPVRRYADVEPADVVLLPAFGVPVAEREHLAARGCILVDTTCGSVLNVWKNVQRFSAEGFTAVIHGKHYHEETRATSSQALTFAGGQYLCVKNREQTEEVCAYIRGEIDADAFLARFREAAGPGFDPARDLQKIGVANQTTMLMSESLEVQDLLRDAMRARHGEAALAERFRAMDTICSATQDCQYAVLRLIAPGDLDVMVVVGGYNSSNTQALARICSARVRTFHVEGADAIGPAIRHRVVGTTDELVTEDWLPAGPVRIGLTAGASTPDNVVGQVVERLLALRGHRADELGPAA